MPCRAHHTGPDEVFLGDLPRLGGVEVGVDRLGGVHRGPEGSLQFDPFELAVRENEQLVDRLQDDVVLGRTAAGVGLLAEVLVDHRQHPIDEVAPRRNEFVVDAPGDLLDGDVGVGLLGEARGQSVAEPVGLEEIEPLLDRESDPARCRGLAALEGDVLVGRHIVG